MEILSDHGGCANGDECAMPAREAVPELAPENAQVHLLALAAVINSIDHGLAAYDAQDRLIVFNRRLLEIIGLPPGLLRLGISFTEIIRGRAALGHYEEGEVAALLERRRDVIRRVRQGETAIEVRRIGGRVFELRHNPLAGGGMVVTCNDVTARVEAERALRESEIRLQDRVNALEIARESLRSLANDLTAARDAAEQASRIKSDFLAHMSHELRTPLNAIIGFSDIMRQELFGSMGNPAYVRYSEDICGSGRHLLQIINDILDLSKIEAGKVQLNIETVDLCDVLRACDSLVRGRADQGGVALEIAYPLLPRLMADELKLKQILLNLLSNAIKFTTEGGRVSLASWVTEEGGVAIEIADSGIGMTDDELAAAILPFSQVGDTFRRKHQGTGLGLPLAKSLVEAHGGTLHLASSPSVGTTARIIFPASVISR